MTMCKPCNITGPTNMTTESISGNSQKLKWKNGQGGMTRIWVSKHANPTANCSGNDGNKSLCVLDDKRIEDGSEEYILTNLEPNTTYYWRLMTWKESGCDAGSNVFNFKTSNSTCTPSTWTPDPALTCVGTSLTQTSNCGTTRTIQGTKNCSCTPNGTVTCSTDCSSACGQQATTITTCTDSCGSPATKQCPATASCCTDTVWLPEANLTCSEAILTQTSNCGKTRTVQGTKNCCVETSWSQTNTSNTCSDRTVTQTSNCGTTREVSGTKTCYPDMSIRIRAYQDDSRNKEGVYYTDKEITKVARGQIIVYGVEVRNTGQGGAKSVVISDTLTEQNQDLLTFVDSESKCKFNFTTKRLTCEIDKIPYNSAENIKFRVRVSQTATNGKIIRNSARVSYTGGSKEGSINTVVSSIVACNETCSNDSECAAGLACDVMSNKCRKPGCLSNTSCNCNIGSTTTPTKTPTTSTTPRLTTTISIPDTDEEPSPTMMITTTKTPTTTIVAEIDAGDDEETYLPESGIFDAPQGFILGGGVILAIIGLFLAL